MQEVNIIKKDEVSTYPKPNVFISAKYKSTLRENKLLALCNSKIRECVYDEDCKAYIQKIGAEEIREAFGLNSVGGSFYKSLKVTAKGLLGRFLGIEDAKSRRFRYISIINIADFNNGVLTIGYNPLVYEQYYKAIDSNYTLLSKKLMMKFNSTYSFRLYELLKSKAYIGKRDISTGNDIYEIKYSVAELQLQMGAVDAENRQSMSVLDQSDTPDYEKAVEVAPDTKVKLWKEFNRSILKPSLDEINNITDIRVETSNITRGRKVTSVKFFVQVIDPEKREMTQDEKDELIDEVSDRLNVKRKDGRTICEAAGYDFEKLEKAILVMESTSQEIKNPVAYALDAIKSDYKPSRRKREGVYLRVEA